MKYCTFFSLIVFCCDWTVDSAPVTVNHSLPDFSLSNEQLSELSSILQKINHITLLSRSDSFDEKLYDAVGQNYGAGRRNKTSEGGGAAGTNGTKEGASGPRSKNTSTSSVEYLFEGDILLLPGQANGILTDLLNQNEIGDESRRERSAAFYEAGAGKWAMPIKFDIDPDIVSEYAGAVGILAIEEALEYWRTHTCVWFQRQSGFITDDYIYFFKGTDDSCYSHVGKVGGKQPISVGSNCAKMGYVAHEIGHALGMWHEQARPDRDNYVQIIWSNVMGQRDSNFLKRTWKETETFGIPYDMGSVMHYGPYAFSVGEKGVTVEPRVEGYRRTIGQRDAPSFLDVKTVNKLYCEGKCERQFSCSNGGYTHPGFCNGCLCPDGLSGTYCDQPEEPISSVTKYSMQEYDPKVSLSFSDAHCGGIIHVNEKWINISSPNHPEHYKNNQRCSWILRSPSGTRVLLEFVDVFQLACGATCSDYVEVKNDTDFANTGMRFCCFERPKEPIYSQSNEMVVIFNSGFTSYTGFKARVIQCKWDEH